MVYIHHHYDPYPCNSKHSNFHACKCVDFSLTMRTYHLDRILMIVCMGQHQILLMINNHMDWHTSTKIYTISLSYRTLVWRGSHRPTHLYLLLWWELLLLLLLWCLIIVTHLVWRWAAHRTSNHLIGMVVIILLFIILHCDDFKYNL